MGHSADMRYRTTNGTNDQLHTNATQGTTQALRLAPGSQRKEDYFCWGVGPSGAVTSDQTPSVIFL